MYKLFKCFVIFPIVFSLCACKDKSESDNNKFDKYNDFSDQRFFSEQEIELKIRFYSEDMLYAKKCFYIEKKETYDNEIIAIQSPMQSSDAFYGKGNYNHGYYLDKSFSKKIDMDALVSGSYGQSVELFSKQKIHEMPQIINSYVGFDVKVFDSKCYFDFNDDRLIVSEREIKLEKSDDTNYIFEYENLYFNDEITDLKITNILCNNEQINYISNSAIINISTYFPSRIELLIAFSTSDSDAGFLGRFIGN